MPVSRVTTTTVGGQTAVRRAAGTQLGTTLTTTNYYTNRPDSRDYNDDCNDYDSNRGRGGDDESDGSSSVTK